MGTRFFGDVKNVVVRPLLTSEKVRIGPKPACYLIENEETGALYAGSTSKASVRINQHMQALKKGTHSNRRLQYEFDRCFDKRAIKVHVALMNSVDEARDREQLILDEDHGHPDLLNVSNDARAPSRGYDRSAPIAKMRETKSKLEHKAIVSQNSKEMWNRPGYRENHIRKNGDNVVVNGVAYGSVREASREIGVSVLTIRSRLVDGVASLANVKKPTRRVSVKGVIYNSVGEAARATGIADNTMTYRCQSSAVNWVDHFYID